MKKFTALLLAVVMAALVFAGCSGSGTDGNAKVYLITMDQTDQHWVNVDKGCKEAAAKLGGITYKWSAPDQKDDSKQIENINNAVADGAKVILLAANSETSVSSALKDAIAKGVKIVYVDSPADVAAEATYKTDNEAAGKTAGEQMLKALKDKGITSGSIGIIGVTASTNSTVNRENGFRSAFKDSGFTLLDTQYGNGVTADSQNIATNFVTQGVVGIFGTNEGSTVGAGNAIKESGKDSIVGVGFDKSDSIKELVTGGYLLCTMAQNPYDMGYKGMEAASKVIKGETITDKDVDTGVTVLNKDNINN